MEDTEFFKKLFEYSLHHRIEIKESDLETYIRAIGNYNNFRSESVLSFLNKIDQIIPRTNYGEGNPNNNKKDYKIFIGRESSPCIYIERYEWISFKQKPLKDDQIELIKALAHSIGLADEADHEIKQLFDPQDGIIEFRFWWD